MFLIIFCTTRDFPALGVNPARGQFFQERMCEQGVGGGKILKPRNVVYITEKRVDLQERLFDHKRKKPRIGAFLLRYLAESNRRSRFCRPMPSHSAKVPIIVPAKIQKKSNLKTYGSIYAKFLSSVTLTRSILPPKGGFIFDTLTRIRVISGKWA